MTLNVLVTPTDVLLEVAGCIENLSTHFTLVGNLLVDPVMHQKIAFSECPSTPLAHVFFEAGVR